MKSIFLNINTVLNINAAASFDSQKQLFITYGNVSLGEFFDESAGAYNT
jgi:hypothetical protein